MTIDDSVRVQFHNIDGTVGLTRAERLPATLPGRSVETVYELRGRIRDTYDLFLYVEVPLLPGSEA